MSARETALALAPELRSIQSELDIFERLLAHWQRSINLVSSSTLADAWLRHFVDSAQVFACAPGARIWADLGSGGGFPGMITALLLKRVPGAVVHLIESDQRKASFLRAVSRETQAPTIVHSARIEQALGAIGAVDAVSARALAPLDRLIALAAPALDAGAAGIFLKGEDWARELTAIPRPDRFKVETHESRTDGRARVVVVKRAT